MIVLLYLFDGHFLGLVEQRNPGPLRDLLSDLLEVCFLVGLGTLGRFEAACGRDRHAIQRHFDGIALEREIIHAKCATQERGFDVVCVPVLGSDRRLQAVPGLGEPWPDPLSVPVVQFDADRIAGTAGHIGVGKRGEVWGNLRRGIFAVVQKCDGCLAWLHLLPPPFGQVV